MNATESNRLFIQNLMNTKRPLTDFPDQVSKDLIIYEPAVLPFGKSYKGLKAHQELFYKLSKFYDFSRMKVSGVYADSNVVFALLEVGIAGSDGHLLLCEKFTFIDKKLTEVRVYIHDESQFPLKRIE